MVPGVPEPLTSYRSMMMQYASRKCGANNERSTISLVWLAKNLPVESQLNSAKQTTVGLHVREQVMNRIVRTVSRKNKPI